MSFERLKAKAEAEIELTAESLLPSTSPLGKQVAVKTDKTGGLTKHKDVVGETAPVSQEETNSNADRELRHRIQQELKSSVKQQERRLAKAKSKRKSGEIVSPHTDDQTGGQVTLQAIEETASALKVKASSLDETPNGRALGKNSLQGPKVEFNDDETEQLRRFKTESQRIAKRRMQSIQTLEAVGNLQKQLQEEGKQFAQQAQRCVLELESLRSLLEEHSKRCEAVGQIINSEIDALQRIQKVQAIEGEGNPTPSLTSSDVEIEIALLDDDEEVPRLESNVATQQEAESSTIEVDNFLETIIGSNGEALPLRNREETPSIPEGNGTGEYREFPAAPDALQFTHQPDANSDCMGAILTPQKHFGIPSQPSGQLPAVPSRTSSDIGLAPEYKAPPASSRPEVLNSVDYAKGIEIVRLEKSLVPISFDSQIPHELIDRLNGSSAVERASAVTDLGLIGGTEAFVYITKAFDDQSPDVRNAAARALYNLHSDRAASFTLALKQGSPQRRRNIGAALASSGLASDAIASLAVHGGDKTYNAFSLLFLMAKAGEVQPLLRTIEDYPSLEVRLAVIKMLALSAQAEIVPVLRRLAVRASLPSEVRSAVMEAIYQISSQNRETSSQLA
jgi:hypothetical protein